MNQNILFDLHIHVDDVQTLMRSFKHLHKSVFIPVKAGGVHVLTQTHRDSVELYSETCPPVSSLNPGCSRASVHIFSRRIPSWIQDLSLFQPSVCSSRSWSGGWSEVRRWPLVLWDCRTQRHLLSPVRGLCEEGEWEEKFFHLHVLQSLT